jgi:hypothetical protein
MDPDFEALAKKRATALGFNFSTYVNQLIRADLSGGGGLMVQEQPETSPKYEQSQSKRKKI